MKLLSAALLGCLTTGVLADADHDHSHDTVDDIDERRRNPPRCKVIQKHNDPILVLFRDQIARNLVKVQIARKLHRREQDHHLKRHLQRDSHHRRELLLKRHLHRNAAKESCKKLETLFEYLLERFDNSVKHHPRKLHHARVEIVPSRAKGQNVRGISRLLINDPLSTMFKSVPLPLMECQHRSKLQKILIS